MVAIFTSFFLFPLFISYIITNILHRHAVGLHVMQNHALYQPCGFVRPQEAVYSKMQVIAFSAYVPVEWNTASLLI